MARPVGRTSPCSPTDARARREHARKFLEVAELVAEDEGGSYASVATSLAVLAGIAAADAACCAALGRRARGQDHRQAEALLRDVAPGGEEAGRALGRLLGLKDTAQYGLADPAGADVRSALRQARTLVDFAMDVLAR